MGGWCIGCVAAAAGSLAFARKLLEARADPRAQNAYGRSPLDLARELLQLDS